MDSRLYDIFVNGTSTAQAPYFVALVYLVQVPQRWSNAGHWSVGCGFHYLVDTITETRVFARKYFTVPGKVWTRGAPLSERASYFQVEAGVPSHAWKVLAAAQTMTKKEQATLPTRAQRGARMLNLPSLLL